MPRVSVSAKIPPHAGAAVWRTDWASRVQRRLPREGRAMSARAVVCVVCGRYETLLNAPSVECRALLRVWTRFDRPNRRSIGVWYWHCVHKGFFLWKRV